MNNDLIKTIQEEIEDMKSLCRDYELVVPSKNIVAKNILATFHAKIDSLNSLLSSSEEIVESPLTKRESEILAYVANGFTNNEIASALRISAKTIEYHLSSIFKKTEATNRTEAVNNAIKLQWIQ